MPVIIRSDCSKAETVARELYDMARARSHLYVLLIASGGLVYFLLLRGLLKDAEAIAREALQQANCARGKLPESASVPLTMLSRVCYERNQLAQAHHLLLRAAEVDPIPPARICDHGSHSACKARVRAKGSATAAWRPSRPRANCRPSIRRACIATGI